MESLQSHDVDDGSGAGFSSLSHLDRLWPVWPHLPHGAEFEHLVTRTLLYAVSGAFGAITSGSGGRGNILCMIGSNSEA